MLLFLFFLFYFILLRNKEPAGNLEEESDRTKSVFRKDWSGLEWKKLGQGEQIDID